MPDRGGTGDAGGECLTHGAVIVVAYPNGDDKVISIADRPVITLII